MLNYRSPTLIAEVIQQALPEFEFVAANDLPDLGVGITPYRDPSEQPRLAGRLVGCLLQQRFRLRDIAILSCRGVASTALKDVERVDNPVVVERLLPLQTGASHRSPSNPGGIPVVERQ